MKKIFILFALFLLSGFVFAALIGLLSGAAFLLPAVNVGLGSGWMVAHVLIWSGIIAFQLRDENPYESDDRNPASTL